MPAKDETGKRYGRLTVLRRDGNKEGAAVWLCLCDCGRQHRVTGRNLRSGGTLSCGCLQRERSSLAHRGPPKPEKIKAREVLVLTIVKKREPYVGGFDRTGYLCGDPPSWLRIGVCA
jgi:hypothetical protein